MRRLVGAANGVLAPSSTTPTHSPAAALLLQTGSLRSQPLQQRTVSHAASASAFPTHNFLSRPYSTDEGAGAGPAPAPAEARLISLLRDRFPTATDIAVADVSGGCGAMYEVYVESPEFKGVRVVKQHQMITDALKAEIKDMHGLRISTAASPS